MNQAFIKLDHVLLLECNKSMPKYTENVRASALEHNILYSVYFIVSDFTAEF